MPDSRATSPAAPSSSPSPACGGGGRRGDRRGCASSHAHTPTPGAIHRPPSYPDPDHQYSGLRTQDHSPLPLWARLLNAPFIAAIWTYRLTLSRLTGNSCRFSPTCSQYALEAFNTYPPWRAVRLTLWRLARCQPLAVGGYDPLPLPIAGRRHPHANPMDDPPVSD